MAEPVKLMNFLKVEFKSYCEKYEIYQVNWMELVSGRKLASV